MQLLAANLNNPSISWGDRFASLVIPHYGLEMRVRAIATKSLLTDEDKKDLRAAFKVAHRWTWPVGNMKAVLRQLPVEHIQEAIAESMKSWHEKDIPKELERLLSIFHGDTLLELSGLDTAENAESWFHSRALIKNSLATNTLAKEGVAVFKQFSYEAKHFFFHILDVLIGLLGVNELGERKNTRWSSEDQMSEYEANYKLERYGKLIGYPAIIFGLIYTYVQFKAAALALTSLAIGLLVVFLVAYQRYWKPCPKDHFGLKNLTVEMMNPHDPIYVRQDILRKIERAFKEKKGVILVGSPGAGKSWIPRSLAEQIEEGKICTFIKDPQIFSSGASKAIDALDTLTERFKKHKEQVIFFFDEFASLFKKDGLAGVSKEDDLKMFAEDFKYVIGATTTKEYKKYIKKKPAIADRRFIVIHVGKIKDKKIKTILSQYLQIKFPAIDLDVTTLDYIVEKAEEFNPNTSKIDAAQTLLNRAIKDFETFEFVKLESKMDKLVEKKKLLEQELLHVDASNDDHTAEEALRETDAAIEKLKKKLDKKNRRAERIKKIQVVYLGLKKESLRMADTKVKLSDHPSLERKWIIQQAKIKCVGDILGKRREKLSLPSRLDSALIDKILAEQKG